MEIFLILCIFFILFSISFFLMNAYLKNDKYAKHNPFKVQIPSKTVWIVKRFRASRILEEGFQDFVPLVDKIEAIISLDKELIYPNRLEVFTLDNKRIKLDYHVMYKVIDPMKALKNVDDYEQTLRSLITISTLNVMSNSLLNENQINSIQKIQEEIEKESLKWGIKIIRIFFDTITLIDDNVTA